MPTFGSKVHHPMSLRRPWLVSRRREGKVPAPAMTVTGASKRYRQGGA